MAVLCLVVFVLISLTLAWTIGPLARVFDPATLAAQAGRLREWSLAPFAVAGLFVVGNCVAVPSTLMITTTVLLFGPWPGTAYAYMAMLVSGSVIYAVGRFAARATVERWLADRNGPRLARFHRHVAQRAITSVALLRFTPIPYPLQNLALGATRIGYPDFLAGTALGLVPGTILLTGVATQLGAWIASPDLWHAALLVGACVVLVAGAWAIRRWVARRA